MYKYSKEKVARFLESAPELTFIFSWFFKSECGTTFLFDSHVKSRVQDMGANMLLYVEKNFL